MLLMVLFFFFIYLFIFSFFVKFKGDYFESYINTSNGRLLTIIGESKDGVNITFQSLDKVGFDITKDSSFIMQRGTIRCGTRTFTVFRHQSSGFLSIDDVSIIQEVGFVFLLLLITVLLMDIYLF
jgi:hypothetical protein